jgi:serine/threonine protein kinase
MMDEYNQEHSFKEAIRQYIEKQLQGEEPDIEKFVSKYPEFKEQIRKKLKEFQKVDSLFDSLVLTDESDTNDEITRNHLIARKIGRFEIVEIIGRGGMGVVYLARDTKLDRFVAIKSIPPESQSDPNARMRFRREARLLASLNHPNIAVIHEIIEQDDGTDYLILEYVPGQTLSEHIAREPLEMISALSICRQVSEAVAAAHEKGIIHRDLKPSNIKVTPDGKIKVLDFGLAKVFTGCEDKYKTTFTQTGRILGTPAYMSPEQARGKSTDYSTDMWSFGCLMYQMLTGRLPFEGETATDILAGIIERDPDWKLLPHKTPRDIRVLLRRCLEKEPRHRLRDMGDIAFALEGTLSELQYPTEKKELVDTNRTLPTKAIAVLPFENLSSHQEQEYFVDGMTDALIAELGKIKALRVISRTSSMHYKSTDKKVPDIVKELDVDAIIEGSVLKAGNDVRITVQLIDTRIDTHLWSENYTGTLDNILALQSKVTLAIAREIEIILTPEEEKRISCRKPIDSKAYEAYLKGIFFMEKHTPEGYRTAAIYFKRAIQIQPDYAQAHAWLGGAFWVPSLWGYAPPHESFIKAKAAMNTAFELDKTCAEALGGIGWIALHYDWDWNKAKVSLEGSIKLNSNYSYGYHGLAWYWTIAGCFETAIEMIQSAIELDPLSHVLNSSLATIYAYSGQHDKAVAQREKTLELDPGFITALVGQTEHYLSMSMYPEAIQSIRKTIDLAGRTPRLLAMLGRAYILSNMEHKAEKLLRELKEKDRDEYISPMHFAALHANLNNADEAFRWLDKAYEERNPMMPFLKIDSSLNPLHSDPRFDRLLKQMDYPE